MLGPLKAMACALFNLGQAINWLLQEQRYQSISQYFNQSVNQSTNQSRNHALWVYRLQPPEPASKDAVFKPGASTWNTDDPKQQHHAPGMQLWLAPWHAAGEIHADVHAILACNMRAASDIHACIYKAARLREAWAQL